MPEPSAPTDSRPASEEVLDGLFEEITEAIQAGKPVPIDHYVARFPAHAERIRSLVAAAQAVVALGRSSGGGVPVSSEGRLGESVSGELGDFRILREIGRGGMGVVYEAEQISLGRRVALKVLPFAGILDERQLTRFRNEARAAASLKHPNIVGIHAVGCERGVHFYAMEYIEGKTLAQVIADLRVGRGSPDPAHTPTEGLPAASPSPEPGTPDPEPAPPADTNRPPQAAVSTEAPHRRREFFRSVARLGIQAAEGLEHAHQMGVVHRDVKPSNLLVDAGGHLWITDFGLAQVQSDAKITMTGDLLGTLRYMSPEQARGQRVLDHRTDIYSLGVTLYELLTLRPPFPTNDRQALLRQVADDDPPRPRQLNPSIPKDLETIVLKAMAKDPERRYATAQEMAEDLKRFLAHEPIRARRPTLSDRAAKWARRHRAVAWSAAVATVVCALTLAASAALVFAAYRGEKQQREIADANAVKARQNYDKARQAVDDMYTGVAEKWLEQKGELTGLQREFLEKALAFYQEFSSEEGADPQVRSEAVLALQRVGAIQEKLGKSAEAEAAFAKSVKQSTELVREHPDRPEFRRELASGRLGLARICRDTGRTKDADQETERANEGLSKLGPDSFADAKHRQRLAQALQRLCREQTMAHRLPEAEAAVKSALKIWESLVKDFPAEIEYRYGQATNYSSQGIQRMWWGNQNEAAEAAFREADRRLSTLQKERPDDVRFRLSLANVLTNLAVVLCWTNRYDEEAEVSGRAVKLFEGLGAESPEVVEYQDGLGDALNNLADAENKRGRSLESEKHYRAALGVHEKLADRHPDVLQNELSFGHTSRNLASLLKRQRKYDEARQVVQAALSRAKKALKDKPAQRPLIVHVVTDSTELASILIELGDHTAAARAIEGLRPLFEAARDPNRTESPAAYEDAHPGRLLMNEAGAKSDVRCMLTVCAALAEQDSRLSPTERKKAAQAYTEQAGLWANEATRALEQWVRGRMEGPGQLGPGVAAQGEIAIQTLEQLEPDRQRLPRGSEARRMSESLMLKALIQKAVELAPDDPSQYQVADLLSSAPEGLRDPDLALKLARRAVERDPRNGMYAQSLGWALFRAGDYQGAIATIKRQTRGGGENDFVLAMAQWQLGEKTEAKARFDRASEWLKGYEQRCDEREKKGEATWPPPSLEKRFQAEAATLLGVPIKPPAAKEKTEKPK